MASSPQLTLGISLQDDATFDNFICDEGSSQAQIVANVKAALKSLLDNNADQESVASTLENSLFLCGPEGSGVSHLLQAACQWVDEQGIGCQYLPLDTLSEFTPEALFDGLEQLPLVCIDDVQLISGQPDWELAIFHFFNRMRDAGHLLLLGADQVPNSLGVQLPDLLSRLQWGGVYQLPGLSDDEKSKVLITRAHTLGIGMPEEVARFLLQRGPRGMEALLLCLNQLDEASLAEQRKLTIPFVKKVLDL